ncbi:MAG: hypothetical protein H0X66_09400 [Verrucomicrobia bacterium]|nr:hypothetical protein [Verrucomicrobiota bacterium]
MLKKHSVSMLLLGAALALQTVSSAEEANSARGNGIRQPTEKIALGTAARSQTAGAISYECDDSCLAPGTPVPAGKYAVVSPVGKQTVQMIAQAPRLDTLDGKTIAVVGGSFMASTTHPEIKRLIVANHPTAKVILLSEIGSAGPFPGPGVIREAKEEFQKKLKEMGVHAVISGNGGCGLCTPKETGSSIAAEYIGIPAVTVAAPTFVSQVYSTAVNHGVPAPRAATYPGAFSAHTPEELIRNTRAVVWPQIVEALTKPITELEIAERRKESTGDPRDRVFAGTIDGVNRFFTEQRWSDGLPIIPPTAERVEEFLKYTDQPWDQVVAVLPIAYRKTLVWHVAVNGVMAGCPPEFMPLLIAYTKALGDGNYRRTLSSTHAWTPYCWINGPVARQLGIDAQQGQINEPRNTALGRFINLAMMNLGGYYIKQDRMGTFGYLMPWAMAEDETACLKIGWQPYHVQKGFTLNQSTLTAASALMWGNNLTPASHNAEKIMEVMAWDAVEKGQFATGSGPRLTHRTMLITEYVARDLAGRYPTKEKLEEALVATARRPAYERAYANYWANPGSAFNPARYSVDQHVKKVIREEGGELTAPPPWLEKVPGQEDIYTVPVMKTGMTSFLITGDADRNKVQTMPGGSTVTVEIKLPANWDELMEKLDYRPLKEFFFTENSPDREKENNPPPSKDNKQTRLLRKGVSPYF